VMLVGEGAGTFAGERGIELVDPSWFRTERRWQQLQDALARERGQASAGPAPAHPYFGTVGAVALDSSGQLAAGTSTGGMTNKRWGRVGDAPLAGAGTWAAPRCAASGTGCGAVDTRAPAARQT